jgi:hypothetical protein
MTDNKLDIKTYSLAEVAEMGLPPDMTNGVRWPSHRLNRGELSGYRVGRTWRMTRADVEDLIERHRNRALRRGDVLALRPVRRNSAGIAVDDDSVKLINTFRSSRTDLVVDEIGFAIKTYSLLGRRVSTAVGRGDD